MQRYFKKLQSIQEDKQNFDKSCLNSLSYITDYMNQKGSIVEDFIRKIQTQTTHIRQRKTQVEYEIQQFDFELRQTKMWNQIKKKALQIQQNNIQNSNDLISQMANRQTQLITTQNNLKLKNTDKLSKDIFQDKDSKSFSKNKISPFASNNAFSPFHKSKLKGQSQVQYRPDQSAMSLKITTFSGVVYEFVVGYLQQQNKFVLKNPHKIFRNQDVSAVKNFNYLKDLNILYQDLKVIIQNYNQDAFV